MNPKGSVLLKKTFIHTKIWPNNFDFSGLNYEKIYKESLSGKMVTVMDIAVDGSSYLVLGQNEKIGPFLWMIEKDDTVGFIPFIKKNGEVIPVGMSPVEEFKWMASKL